MADPSRQPHVPHTHDIGDVSSARLVWAVVLNLALTVVEVVVGLFAGSLMLLADALHNFSDGAALVVAAVARRISRRKADARFTFGYRRAELVGAIVNLTALVIVGLYLVYEAIVRLTSPHEVAGGPVMIAAAVALVVDTFIVLLLGSMARGSLNVRAAFVHNLSDALSSVAVLAGGAAIAVWGWTAVDPVLTIVIAVYILIHGSVMFRSAASTLMNASPRGTDPGDVARDLCALEGVVGVHHVHVWELDEHERSLEAHVVIRREDAGNMESIKRRVKKRLRRHHKIRHCTLEIELTDDESAGCSDEEEARH